MFDFAWSELMVIGAVALVVIGPKDLPKALKTAGMMVRRARSLAREFQNSIDDMIREAELEEVRKTVQETTRFDLDKTIHKTLDPDGALNDTARITQSAAPEKPVEEAPALTEPFVAPHIPPAAHHD